MTDAIKAIEVQRKNTERLPLEDQPTMLLPVVSPREVTTDTMIARVLVPKPKKPVVKTKEVLCFEVRDVQGDTLDLINEVVNVCLRETHKYPVKVIIEPLRYLSIYRHIEAINAQSDIKLVCADQLVSYDVMAVCDA